jgi:membrane-associated phospholipid phosphatase
VGYFEIIVLIFGMLFNRGYCFLSGFVSLYYAYYNTETLLIKCGLSQHHYDSDSYLRIKVAIGFFIFNVIAAVSLVLITQVMKKAIRRTRPKYIHAERIRNLSILEKNSHSMPSGDTAQGALWCGLMYLFFQIEFTLVVLPLVAISRVFYQCHWISDTIIGGIVGLSIALLFH